MLETLLPFRKGFGLAGSNRAFLIRDRTSGFCKARAFPLKPSPYGQFAPWIVNKAWCREDEAYVGTGDIDEGYGVRNVDKQETEEPLLTNPISRSIRPKQHSFREEPRKQLWMEKLEWLDQPDIKVDGVTYAKLVRLCGNSKALLLGKQLHMHIIKSGHTQSILLGNLLLQTYDKCEALEDALAVFNNMYQRNVFSWSLIIGACTQRGQCEKALQLFEEMELTAVIPDKVIFVVMISACADEAALVEGKQLHTRIVNRGLETDVYVGNALVNMYSKCGSLEDSCRIFIRMPVHNVVSWNTIIGVYMYCEQGEEALPIFQQMQVEGVLPDKFTFVSILNVHAYQSVQIGGKQCHSLIIGNSFESDVVVRTALVKMYSEWGSLEDARQMFDNMRRRDLISWNAMVAAYAQHSHRHEVFELFQQMCVEGVMPDNVTYVILISVCADLMAVQEGKRVHACIVSNEFESEVVVGNALITMYGKCGNLESAHVVFDNMPERDVISWNTIIAAHVQQGQGNATVQLFQQMRLEGVMPNKVTFVSLLDACASLEDAVEGSMLQSLIVGTEFEVEVMVGNAVANMYGKCGCLDDAQKVFHKMSERDVSSWNAMITAYVQHGQGNLSLQLYQQMQLEGVITNKAMCVNILDVCASEANLAEGRHIHVYVLGNSFELDTTVGTCLVNMYSKCGSLEAARNIFDTTPDRDVVSWNAMIAAYCQHGQGKEALQLFQQMQRPNVAPNTVTLSCILSACSHAGLVQEGCSCFISISHDHRIAPTVKQYNILLDLLARAGQLEVVEELLHNMPCQPSATSWLTLLAACRDNSDVNRGRRMAEHVLELDPDNAATHVLLSNIHVTASWVDVGNQHVMHEGSH